MFQKLKNWIKGKLIQLKQWIKKKIIQFIRSRFFLSVLMLTIGISYTYCFLTIKYEYQDFFGSRVVSFSNSSVALANTKVEASSNQETKEAASPEVQEKEQSDSIIRLIEKTFPEDPKTAVAIVKCESQLDPSRIGDTHMDYYSYGLFQVNQTWHKYSKEVLLNPKENIKIARKIYDGAGWQRWACYTGEGYKNYL